MPFFVVVLDAGEANLLFNGEIVDVVDEPVNPSASSALSVKVSVSEREMLPFSSPAPGTAEPDDFERKILRDNLAEWNVIGEPPLIKSGGVSGLSSVISFTPRLGDVDGTKGGEENMGVTRRRA